MIGDDMRDVNAGINSGCIPIFLINNKPYDNMDNIKTFVNLRDFTENFLSHEIL
jgi:histidinol phosphatase-like enzyme